MPSSRDRLVRGRPGLLARHSPGEILLGGDGD